jgi:branched-chain amino acid transport system ATP-binding protein
MAVDRSALKLSGVRKQFGSTHIINGVDLDIREGERHALIGPNGAGKSTLFNLISGRFPLTSGQIQLKGQDITNQEPQSINRLGLSRSFQITNIFPKLSVFENLRCAVLWNLGYRYSFFKRISALKDARESADRTLSLIGLEDRREKMAGELTYAEQRALEIGITIASGADVILLDEPTAGMSHSETDAAVALIEKVTQLVYGEVIATGTPSEIRNNPRVQEAYLGTQLEDEVSS